MLSPFCRVSIQLLQELMGKDQEYYERKQLLPKIEFQCQEFKYTTKAHFEETVKRIKDTEKDFTEGNNLFKAELRKQVKFIETPMSNM